MDAVPWLVLPTYDEAENLEAMIAAVVPILRDALGRDGFRVLIVDDASPDGTGELADGLAARHPEVQALHRPAREGLGPAYLHAFAVALAGGASHVIEMDCDFSHEPQALPRLIAAAGDADLVLGSRYVAGGVVTDWGVVRRTVSWWGSWYARRVLDIDVRDLTGGFKCFRREVLEAIDLPSVRSKGYAFQVELTYRTLRAGFRVIEVPIVFRERRLGRSKMSARIALEAMVLLPRLRRQATAALTPKAG
ncbi:MAG TPA: polyprenol monophosphomannose synthase [Solirubrobacteraceae bacterium]|nr:polyprenol monophosphomannose synthase [Solirubrobacteraceae bacterium]